MVSYSWQHQYQVLGSELGQVQKLCLRPHLHLDLKFATTRPLLGEKEEARREREEKEKAETTETDRGHWLSLWVKILEQTSAWNIQVPACKGDRKTVELCDPNKILHNNTIMIGHWVISYYTTLSWKCSSTYTHYDFSLSGSVVILKHASFFFLYLEFFFSDACNISRGKE